MRDFIFSGSKITADGDCSHEIKRCLLLRRKATTNLDSIFKKQRHYCVDKGTSIQSYGFCSSHVWMWDLDHKESWVPKNWCFWTVVLEKSLESTLACTEIQPINPKRSQSWILIARTDAETSSSTLATWRTNSLEKTMILEKLKAWVWAQSWSWWWTGSPSVLPSMGS